MSVMLTRHGNVDLILFLIPCFNTFRPLRNVVQGRIVECVKYKKAFNVNADK